MFFFFFTISPPLDETSFRSDQTEEGREAFPAFLELFPPLSPTLSASGYFGSGYTFVINERTRLLSAVGAFVFGYYSPIRPLTDALPGTRARSLLLIKARLGVTGHEKKREDKNIES